MPLIMRSSQQFLLCLVFTIGSATSAMSAPTPINLYYGNWAANSTYAIGNVVTHNNQTWLSLASRNRSQTPGLSRAWQLLGSNIPGPAGPQGPVGPQGLPGPQGIAGPIGAPGPQGVAGKDGVNGKDGAPGIQGVKGDMGLQGPKGDQGIQGLKGDPGVAGKDGINGKDGASVLSGTGAPDVGLGAVGDFFIDTANNHFYGPKTAEGWPDTFVAMVGPKGDQGLPGPAGAQGLPGADGKNGIDGKDGVPGIQGVKGDTGAQGPQGEQGPIGTTGPQGAKGDKGDAGATGLTGPKGDTGSFPSGSAVGDMQYWDGTRWVMIPAPNPLPVAPLKAFLSFCNGKPSWDSACPGQPPVTPPGSGYYKVGDLGPAGGIVVWVNYDGTHGLEAAVRTVGDIYWGCTDGTAVGSIPPNGTSTDFGSGASNTAKMVTTCPETNNAAKMAQSYTLNGYQDFYLPSRDEMIEIIKSNLVSDYSFWTSSELDGATAYYVSPGSPNPVSGSSAKSSGRSIRPVRSF